MEDQDNVQKGVEMNDTSEAPEAPEIEAKLNVLCNVEDPGDGSTQVIATKDGNEAGIFYNFGTNLDEMVELFGADVVYSYAKGQMTIRLQAAMRSRMKTGGDIAGLITEFKPGVALPKSPVDMNKATENYFSGLSEEEQDAMIERLLEKKGA